MPLIDIKDGSIFIASKMEDMFKKQTGMYSQPLFGTEIESSIRMMEGWYSGQVLFGASGLTKDGKSTYKLCDTLEEARKFVADNSEEQQLRQAE